MKTAELVLQDRSKQTNTKKKQLFIHLLDAIARELIEDKTNTLITANMIIKKALELTCMTNPSKKREAAIATLDMLSREGLLRCYKPGAYDIIRSN